MFALGLSEPDVGADLASVRTNAQMVGDSVIINGSKRWCSGAESADYIYALVRSGPVEDRLAIRELVDSYNDAVMRLDGEAWASNWMEDGIWSLPGVGEVAGKAKFYPMWQQAMSAFSFVGFFASAGPIVVTGDTAHGTWYQQEFLHMKAGGKQTITGRYEDDYVRKDGRWYFAKRVYAVLDRQVTE